MLTSRGSAFVIQMASTVVLARLLTPADFGLVAMVMAITGLGQAFADLGLSEATIQREEINHAQVSVLFWINVGIGVALTLVTAAIAPVLVWFYRDPQLRPITYALSFTFLICSLRVQHEALLRRQMRFFALAIRAIIANVVAVALAIIVAWRGGGYWALVVLPLSLNFMLAAISWVMAGWMPGLPRRGAKVGSMVGFGAKVAASYLTSSFIQNAGNMMIGWQWGAGPLGLFSRASNLLSKPVKQLSGPVGGVVVPAFSRINRYPERFERYYLRAANLVLWITAPVFAFLIVSARSVVLLILGPQWLQAVPIFQFLAITALVQPIQQLTQWMLVSRGESDRLLKLRLILLPIFLLSYVVGLPFGVKVVALSSSVFRLMMLPWILKFSFRNTELNLKRVIGAVKWPIILSFMGAGMAELALHQFAPHHILSELAVVALGFAAAFVTSALIPPVRKEFFAFRELLGSMRVSRQAA